ncbi:MAG: YerC/YecD family TrpR-related protein [Oscillospiraceae bacterium]|nr:YerC/YecD family TrpR-related protein [Oscillospiraceae bacterium]
MASRKKRDMTLYELIMKLKSPEECCRFFQDLCTPEELRAMEQRLEVALCLNKGMVYQEILNQTGVSSATVSRVRRSTLDDGDGGVMREVLQREMPDD